VGRMNVSVGNSAINKISVDGPDIGVTAVSGMDGFNTLPIYRRASSALQSNGGRVRRWTRRAFVEQRRFRAHTHYVCFDSAHFLLLCGRVCSAVLSAALSRNLLDDKRWTHYLAWREHLS